MPISPVLLPDQHMSHQCALGLSSQRPWRGRGGAEAVRRLTTSELEGTLWVTETASHMGKEGNPATVCTHMGL